MASFDENGKYIKTNWKAGDKITATKLNKIEESIEAVNDNDISRHVEADARLDALEAKDVAHDKEFANVKNTIANNKAAAELGDYEINSRMTFLENELNEGIEEVHNVAETVDGKIATAEANMTAQVNTAKDEMTAQVDQGKADMEAMVAEVEADLEGLHAKDEELSAKLEGFINLNNFINSENDDYTTVFKNAIDYCIENQVKLFIPAGVYEIGQLKFDYINNLHIEGVIGQTILKRKSSDIVENLIQMNDTKQNGELYISGIVFDGMNYADANYGLVQGNGIKKAVIENCSFLNTVKFNSISFSGGSKAIIRNCYFKDTSSGPYLLCNYSVVENCIFEGNIKWGIQSTGTTNQVVTDCIFNGITGGVICGNTSYNSDIQNIIIKNCFFKEIKSPGVNNGVIVINNSLPSETSKEDINIIIDSCIFEEIQTPPFYIGGSTIPDGFNYNCRNIKILNNIISISNSSYSNEPIFNIYNVCELLVSNNNIRVENSTETAYNVIQLRGEKNKNIEFYDNNIIFEQPQTNKPNFVSFRPKSGCTFEVANLRIDNFKSENMEFSRLIHYDVSAGSPYSVNSSVYFINNKNDLTCYDDYTTSDLYRNIYFKYIYSNTGRDYCQKDYAIGLLSYVEKSKKIIYYNGENILSLQGTV